MNFTTSLKTCILQKYIKLSGRARRSEYWWFSLFLFGASLICAVLDKFMFDGMPFLQAVVGLGLFLPSLGVLFRRLHDTNRSGWWLLLILIPLIGYVVILIFTCLRGTNGPNRFGTDSLTAA